MVVLFDTLSSIIALVLAMITRFIGFSHVLRSYPRDHSLYNSLFFLVVIINIFSWNYHRKKNVPLEKQDPAQRLSAVINNRVMMFVLILIYLYITIRSMKVSRIVMFFFLIYDVILDFVIRTLYARFLKNRKRDGDALHKLIIIANANRLPIIRRRLEINGSNDIDIVSLISWESLNNTSISHAFTGLKSAGANEILLDSHALFSDELLRQVVTVSEELELPIRCLETSNGEFSGEEQFQPFSGFMTFRYSGMHKRADVLGVKYAVSNISEAVIYVKRHISSLSGKYLCFSNVHTTITAGDDPEYMKILNESAITFPDGSPIARTMRGMGFSNANQVAGPDFMEAMFQASMDGSVRHFFYGASESTLEALRKRLTERFPGMVIAGMYSPPFRPLSPEEDEKDIQMINSTDPDIVWVGLGAPKQEKWMNAHMDRVHGVMCGVGAGFDFHADTVRRAPGWIQRINLEWFYRLLQDPVRLFKRYFITNSKFIFRVILMRFSPKK